MATYSISPSVTEVDEGGTVTFTVETDTHDGSNLYWTIAGTNVSSGDFSPSGLSGTLTSVPITGSVTFSKTLSNDSSLEGYEFFIVQLRITGTAGEIVAITPSIRITDTSTGVTPDPNQGTIRMVSSEGFVYRSSGTWYKIVGSPITL